MFFSFNSEMVIDSPKIRFNETRSLKRIRFSVFGRFPKEGYSGKTKHYKAGGQGCFKQPAFVPQQNFPVPTILPAAPRLRSGPKHHSSFPGFWCWAGGTSAWPWRQAGKAYTGSATFVKRQTHDQSACESDSFLISMGISPSPPGPGNWPEPQSSS